MPQWPIKRACHVLQRGGVIAYATEAIWGLGCDPASQQAVERLLQIKQRPLSKGLILIAANSKQLENWTELSALQSAQVQQSWPGHITWVLPASKHCPQWLTGGRDSIAVRVTAKPQVSALCEQFGGAIVSTSANLSGRTEARKRLDLLPLRAHLHYVLPGSIGTAKQASQLKLWPTGLNLRG